ncbi:ExbD/TolR family protein [Thalassotalea sp. PS06]|uniref:ExbD/TolR family protein n=1 Tax=Thalassotalea sp. PS06 TaxID=2594005 RepID=UPI001162FBA8|nr:biopolymer transporter ExbD [Thalassotalea sp. PS06]QDP01925.1 biopolymer transporter ExbD [Thalassotalea sp. PS06]
MKQSLRAKRMQRHHERNSKVSKLSLVSLMDIFTILVFFLMVNASDVQVLQTNKQLELPESVSEEAAEENLLIMVNANNVILQGRQIITVEELMALEGVIVESLNDELEYQKNRKQLTEDELENGLSINIMADKTVPYALLKKVMQTSASAGYTNISLAVEQVYANTDALLEEAQAAETGEAGQ